MKTWEISNSDIEARYASYRVKVIKTRDDSLWWSWIDKNEWQPVENINTFLSVYFPKEDHDEIKRELGL